MHRKIKKIYKYDSHNTFTNESNFDIKYPIKCWYVVKQMNPKKLYTELFTEN